MVVTCDSYVLRVVVSAVLRVVVLRHCSTLSVTCGTVALGICRSWARQWASAADSYFCNGCVDLCRSELTFS